MIARAIFTITALSILSCVFFSAPTFAYEVETHGEISEQAAVLSNLNDILPGIGLADLETSIETDYLNEPPKSARLWLRYGSIHPSVLREFDGFYGREPPGANSPRDMAPRVPCIGGSASGRPKASSSISGGPCSTS